jgi:hypothetical protein
MLGDGQGGGDQVRAGGVDPQAEQAVEARERSLVGQ